ncbi:methyl-accepting chemotaxis protein [Actinoplanes sp. L3-i22]|uniref:methyl-accepting chemotaxis protein n=1 Tax=Actinoplanes sp. L3-i22 TaxID=2836373 RepID=UPI001C860080|nr:methyl-accepting chemotaxis protein [Actinoplanes sp. L3-i22]
MSATSSARPRRGRASGWFGDLPVAAKIFTAVGVVAAAAVAAGVLAVASLATVYASSEAVVRENMAPALELADLHTAALGARIAVRDVALKTDKAAAVAALQKADDAVTAAVATYRPHANDPAAIDEFSQIWQQYLSIRDAKQIPAARADNLVLFEDLATNTLVPLVNKAFAALDTAREAETTDAHRKIADAQAQYHRARLQVILLVGLGVLIGAVVAAYTVRRIVGPLRQVGAVLTGLAGGDLTGVASTGSRDEIGRMADALDTATTSLRDTVQEVSRTAAGVATSASELAQTTITIAGTAEGASGQTQTVAAAATDVSERVQSVVAGAEEMSAAIREIAESASDAARVAAAAVTAATSASRTVAQLDTSSAEIGNVLNLITSIAEQTNLLALNATIEAARAGDMGKGFAVVASEVKDLAQETARATEDISGRVAAIQADAQAAATSINEIARVIEEINQYQTTIAAAVEEQTATTGEISRNIAHAAAGTTDIAGTIGQVAAGATTTSTGMRQARAATEELAVAATGLQNLVQRFRF